jgi:hypothetical protein
MTLPAFIFGLIVSTLYGAAFHLWKNGGFLKLLLFLSLALIGFWTGHLVGRILNITFVNIGPLNFGTATLGSVILLIAGYWLTLESTG